MNGRGGKDELTLIGLVIPTRWGANGEITAVAILTRDEDEYEVEPEGMGVRLLNHLRREILAHVVRKNDPNSTKGVQVISFAVLDWENSTDDLVRRTEIGL